jgi:hypothetical protein
MSYFYVQCTISGVFKSFFHVQYHLDMEMTRNLCNVGQCVQLRQILLGCFQSYSSIKCDHLFSHILIQYEVAEVS